MATGEVHEIKAGSIEAQGLRSVGRVVADNGIAGALVLMLIEVGAMPNNWQGPQTIIVLTALGGIFVKFLRKLLFKYKLVD